MAPDTSLLDLATSLSTVQDVDTLLGQISAAVEKMTSSAAASILLLNAEKTQLVFRAATGEKGSSVKKFYVPVGKGIAGWVAENGKPVVSNDVVSDTRFTGQIDKSSGFNTTSVLAVPMFSGGNLLGVCEALNKVNGGAYDESDQRVLEQLAAFAAATIQNAREAEDHRNFYSRVLEILITATEGSDTRVMGHSYRVAELACRIGRQLGLEGQNYKNLYYGALLHDLGMVAIHDLRYLPTVLNKTMERTPDKLHPLVGAELIKDIKLLSPIAPIIRHHHEYVDGTGHPDGLVGADIPLASRIICLVEHLEELRMKGLVGEEFEAQAAKLVTEGSGTKFDQEVVDAFLSLTN